MLHTVVRILKNTCMFFEDVVSYNIFNILHECLHVSSPENTFSRVRLLNRLLFVGNNKGQRWVAPVTITNTKFRENR
jgi:hypothetical protein